VLNQRYELHDIRDTEAFCAYILQRSRLTLTPQDHEDALAYLIEETWILSTRHRPGNTPFSAHAATRLPQRLIDWQRKRKDTRYPSNTKYTTVSIDEPAGHIGLPTYNHRIRNRLDNDPTPPRYDHLGNRNADQLVRLLRTRSRSTTRNHHPPHPRTTNQPTQQP
jgi:hypothetical protein